MIMCLRGHHVVDLSLLPMVFIVIADFCNIKCLCYSYCVHACVRARARVSFNLSSLCVLFLKGCCKSKVDD